MGRAMLSKPLIKFSVDGWGFVPSLLFDLRPNYGGCNEESDHLLQKVPCTHCCTQCPQLCSRLLLTQTSWTLMSKSESVSCGVTVAFSWVLVHTKFCLCPPSLFPQSCDSSGGSMVGLMVTSRRAYAIPRSTVPRVPSPATVLC